MDPFFFFFFSYFKLNRARVLTVTLRTVYVQVGQAAILELLSGHFLIKLVARL
jgi:hypothetical protein